MHRLFVLTGAPGSGKSALLDCLRRSGVTAIDEPARQILAEQRSFGGHGVPERDPALFVELMLSRAVFEYRRQEASDRPIVFDRGVPDLIAYASLYGLDATRVLSASRAYRYNPTVFFAPAWEEIYCNDDERKMTFDQARDFGERMRDAYLGLNYELLDLPRDTPGKRAGILLKALADRSE